jgi:hypothetical protein
LQKIGNYLLFGEEIKDTKLLKIGKTLWEKYDNELKARQIAEKEKSEQRRENDYKRGPVDNTGKKNN